MTPIFIFRHGFGFEQSFWRRILPYFDEYECHTQSIVTPPLGSTHYIGIGHSLGLHHLLSMPIPFTAYIGINSFTDFLGFDDDLRARRQIEYQNFCHQINTNQNKTLYSFYRRCGLAKKDMPNCYQAQDLKMLAKRIKLNAKIPALFISSQDDIIVPPELIIDNISHTKNNIEHYMHPTGCHLLGLNEEEQVAKCIKKWLRQNVF